MIYCQSWVALQKNTSEGVFLLVLHSYNIVGLTMGKKGLKSMQQNWRYHLLLLLLFHAFIFLVKTWHSHYPHCPYFSQLEIPLCYASLCLKPLASRRSLINSLLSNSTPPDFFLFKTCSHLGQFIRQHVCCVTPVNSLALFTKFHPCAL